MHPDGKHPLDVGRFAGASDESDVVALAGMHPVHEGGQISYNAVGCEYCDVNPWQRGSHPLVCFGRVLRNGAGFGNAIIHLGNANFRAFGQLRGHTDLQPRHLLFKGLGVDSREHGTLCPYGPGPGSILYLLLFEVIDNERDGLVFCCHLLYRGVSRCFCFCLERLKHSSPLFNLLIQASKSMRSDGQC